MNNIEFASLIRRFLDYPTVYVNGAFGAVASDYNKKRYKNSSNVTRWKKIEDCPSNGFFTDCCGIIKGVLWGWVGDTSKIYGGAQYKANGVPDLNELGLIEKCVGVSTDFSHVEVGEMVYMKGHCGVYIGEGLVVESTPKWSCGVQITGVANLGKVYNGKSRTWTKHGKLPWVDYASEPQPEKYTIELFRKDVRAILGVKTNQEAFTNAPTISVKKNRFNALVTPLERYMSALGYYNGEIEADKGKKPEFGGGMERAIKYFQREIIRPTNPKHIDGELTKGGATWKKLLIG